MVTFKKELIKKHDKLIGEFMNIDSWDDSRYGTMYRHGDKSYMSLKYRSSWDWLMPVVEKIENIEMEGKYFVVDIAQNVCEIYNKAEDIHFNTCIVLDSKILATHLAVVRFIQWYNEVNNLINA